MNDLNLVVELLSSYNDNCRKVEEHAMHQLFSLEIAVFNRLRDVSAFNLLLALRRMDEWFGKVRTCEHALCLVMLTDYISCAYNQRLLYKTFENALTNKFIKMLFINLYNEWIKVFDCRQFIYFADLELESIRKSLLMSVNRFPDSFQHKHLLNRIVKLCEEYKNVLSENSSRDVHIIPKYYSSSEKKINTPPIKRNNLNLTNVLTQKKSFADMTRYIIRKDHVSKDSEIITENLSEANFHANVNEEQSQRSGKVKEINISKIDDDLSNSSSEIEIMAEFSRFCNSSKKITVKDHRNILVVSNSKKLNAFDILMKKTTTSKHRLNS